MCGFVGFCSKNVKDKNVIKEMNNQIVHRGPDSDGYYFDKDVNFGFRRLSIIDLKEGSQPILNEAEDVAIIFNGEIYNYQEIREELVAKGYKFKTHTDTEVILHGYEEYGEEGILAKLRGMFAFTIWDSKKEKLFGARDHFGIKPYYYAMVEGDFLFGSEVKAFLKYPKFNKEVNEKALKHYLVFQYNPLEETFFKGVKKLRPGHYYIYENGKMEIKTYYNLTLDYQKMTFDEAVGKIEKEVEESVKYHKISDVEVGSFLSGGVDSSYVVATALPDKTFSVGFDNKGFNETIYAKELSDSLGINNYSKLITPDEFFEGINKVQYYSDEPHANLSSVPLYFLSKLASEQVKVVLSGEGADELFAGYNEYADALPQRIYRKLPFGLRNKLYKKYKDRKHFSGKTIIMKYGQKVEDRYIGPAEIMSDEQANSLVTSKYKNTETSRDLTRKYYDEVKDMDDTSKRLYLDMKMWIVEDILLKADKMTMANSIELRVPLLDKKMWELARTIPVKHKVHNEITKYAFRKAAKNKLPEDWAKRRKLGFVVPFVVWIREEKYYKIVKEIFNKGFVSEFFDKEKINSLLDDHFNNIANNGRKIYTIYTFLKWYEIYFATQTA
ncbi:putative asparagine synthase 1 [Catonella morbi ATCC 51271]|uniref:asparagine synthase (glutamine-hydrolyzing) n=1 Tax=Catonella morbi ATCC 51271 TaxID=592026 RepID=V2XIJ7_9FIRM|nr:asparagine synthase (glutamine-hydrolyzing) [Catonella morbi]ESL01999.1 putative asparagine synthase 1 [Catonella morbi ATCC 51271]